MSSASGKSPLKFHILVGLVIAGGLAVGMWWLVGMKNVWPAWLACWLVAINGVTFGYFGFDKARSKREGASRVPELALHTMSAVGGSPGAYAAMQVFRHKTIKGPFRVLFWVIVVLQVAFIAWIVKMAWWD